MIGRAAIAAIGLCGLATPSLAEDYACRSLEGDPPVELGFTIRHSSGAYAVMAARFQIKGDIGYSTTASEPTSLATISGVDISPDEVLFRFHYQDAGYDGDVARVHVVTLSEGAHSLTAGVLQVTGGGLWAIACDIDHEG